MTEKKLGLTGLEAEIMHSIWEAGDRSLRVRDVLESINQTRKPPLAYTTVQTVMNILKDKGILKLVPGDTRAHEYVATVSRDQVSRDMLWELAHRLFGGQLKPLMLQLMDDEALTAEELASLRDVVDQRLRKQQKRKS